MSGREEVVDGSLAKLAGRKRWPVESWWEHGLGAKTGVHHRVKKEA